MGTINRDSRSRSRRQEIQAAPTVPLRLRTPRVLWTGSFFRRVEKCYDSIVLPLMERLRSQGIDGECHIVDSHYGEKRTQAEMARWFNTGTILLCASVEEGTPNPALEASGCGCTVVSTRVGNMPDLIRHGENGFLADGDRDSLEQAVHAAYENYPRLAEQMQHDIQGWHWALRSKSFFDVFRAVLRPDTEEALAS